MRQNRYRKVLRHVLALLCALPFLLTVCFKSDNNKERVTCLNNMTQTLANYIGDASFACTGSLAAGMEGMDLLGCVIVGYVTALGGGTLRDVFLGRFPIWWMLAWDEFLLVVGVSTLTFFGWPCLSTRLELTSTGEWLFWTDAIGLGVFAASGASTGAAAGDLHVAACAFCGMCTATFGGLTRDVLIARSPRILYPMLEVYAVPAYLGGFACAATLKFVDEHLVMEAIMLGVWVTVHGRVLAVNHGLRLPTFPAAKVYSKQSRPRDIATQLAMEEDLHRDSLSYSEPGQSRQVSASFRQDSSGDLELGRCRAATT